MAKTSKVKWEYRNKIDYLPQIARFPKNLKVKELLSMIHDIRGGVENSDQFIELFNLEPFLNQRLGNLSGGTLQKVNITLALMYDSPLLILDEPTTGLDPLSLVRLKQLILTEKAKGKIILITTHIMSFVEEMADNVIFLLEGNIHFNGNVKQLKSDYNAENGRKLLQQFWKAKKADFSDNGHSKKDVEFKIQN